MAARKRIINRARKKEKEEHTRRLSERNAMKKIIEINNYVTLREGDLDYEKKHEELQRERNITEDPKEERGNA